MIDVRMTHPSGWQVGRSVTGPGWATRSPSGAVTHHRDERDAWEAWDRATSAWDAAQPIPGQAGMFEVDAPGPIPGQLDIFGGDAA